MHRSLPRVAKLRTSALETGKMDPRLAAEPAEELLRLESQGVPLRQRHGAGRANVGLRSARQGGTGDLRLGGEAWQQVAQRYDHTAQQQLGEIHARPCGGTKQQREQAAGRGTLWQSREGIRL